MARFQLDDDIIRLQFPGGKSMSFEIEDVGTIETGTSTVMGQEREVIEVEHTDNQDRSVETDISGMDHHTRRSKGPSPALSRTVRTITNSRRRTDRS